MAPSLSRLPLTINMRGAPALPALSSTVGAQLCQPHIRRKRDPLTMSRYSRPLRFSRRSIVAIAVAALFLFVGLGAAATSSSASCGSCHVMRPFVDSLARSAHSQVHCYDCHLEQGAWSFPDQKATEWTTMVKASLLGRGLSGPSVPMGAAPCLRCHSAVMSGVIKSGGIRIKHSTCAASPAVCTDCHSAVAHGASTRWINTPVMEKCVQCHIEKSGPTACDSCHAGKSQHDRLRSGPWQVTHGSTWKTTHGLSDLTYCRTCHPADYCVKCHGVPLPHGVDFGRTHGALSLEPGAKCLDCHSQKLLCDTCHRIPMPHPTGFLKVHSTVEKRLGAKVCSTCHDRVDCEGCHQAHTHPGRTDGTLGRGPNGAIGVPAPKVKP